MAAQAPGRIQVRPARRVPPGRPAAGHRGRAGSAVGARAWLVAAGSLVLAVAAYRSRVLSVDAFYDLYAGRYLAAHGIPQVNVLTAASHGAPWIDQQWLAHLGYYGAWALAGYPGVATVSVLLTVAGWVVLAMLMLRRGVPPTRMFAWTITGAVVCLADYQIQAQNFGYPLFALTLWLLLADADADAPRPRPRTWLVVAVLVAWANLHGSVLLGVASTGLYAGRRVLQAAARRDLRAMLGYCGLGIAALAAVACTPYGGGVLGYYLSLLGNPELPRYIARWAMPAAGDPATWLFAAVVVAVLAALVLAWRQGVRPDPFLGILCAALLLLAVSAARNEDWFAFGGVLAAADARARSSADRVPILSRGFTSVVSGLLAAAAAAGYLGLATTTASQFQSQAPVRAIAAAAKLAARHPDLRILGDAYTGTSMLWLQPAATVGRDGFDVRFEQYSRRQLAAYFRFIFGRGPHWQQVTSGYQLIVISRHSVRLSHLLTRLPGWRLVFADPGGMVFRRTSRR